MLLLLLLLFSTDCGTDRERRSAVQDVENNGFRTGAGGVQDDANVGGGDLRLDGSRGHQIVDLLEGFRRVELRNPFVGDPHRRNAVQGHRRPGRRLRRRCQ